MTPEELDIYIYAAAMLASYTLAVFMLGMLYGGWKARTSHRPAFVEMSSPELVGRLLAVVEAAMAEVESSKGHARNCIRFQGGPSDACDCGRRELCAALDALKHYS